MTDEHRTIFQRAQNEALQAHERLGRYRRARPDALGPFGPNMRRADERQLLDSYKQLLSIQFVYNNDAEVGNAVAVAEAYFADEQIAFQDEAGWWRQQLQEQYMEQRQRCEQVQQNVFAWQRAALEGRFDGDAYHNQLDLYERHAREAAQMYPEHQTFKAMLEQIAEIRRRNEY